MKDTVLDNTHEIETVMLCRKTWSGVACAPLPRCSAPYLRLGDEIIHSQYYTSHCFNFLMLTIS